MRARDSEFEAFVRRSRSGLLRRARLLSAHDQHLAEDLVQQTLVKLYLAWTRARNGDLDAYARRVLVNTAIDHSRRPFRQRERLGRIPENSAETGDDGLDPELTAALAALPARMRAAVVLRHVEGLTVEETADALGCSEGNVKSQTARGLAKLRDALGEHSATTTP